MGSAPIPFPDHVRKSQAEPEAVLMERVRLGEAAAFGEIVDRYWPLLVTYGARLLGDVEEARDAAQEVLVQLWEGRTEWQPGSPRGYLYRATRNQALDRLRQRKAREKAYGALQRLVARNAPRTPAQVNDEAELANILNRAIQNLPERRREVFTLAYRHGLSYSEIGDIMGIARQTVANQMSAALAGIRKAVEPYLSGPRERRPSE